MENGQQFSSQSTTTTTTTTTENNQNDELNENNDNSNEDSPPSEPRSRRCVSRPLQRNQACFTCRSRKVRCDAQKPACGACSRSAKAHGQDPSLVVCHYDHTPDPDSCEHYFPIRQNKKPSPQVIALRRKIAETERLISQFHLDAQQPSSAISSDSLQHSMSTGSSGSYPILNPSEVFWSNWPSCLPPRRILTHLVKLYLSSQSSAGQAMFVDPAQLLANLHLSPDRPDFPFTGLLHAIMALAYRQSVSGDPDQFALNLLRVCNVKRYWPMEVSVHRYHADRAKFLIEQALFAATHLFQLAQALNLYCYYAYETVQLVPAWVCSGLAIRFSTPLGLNQLEKSKEHLEGSKPKPKSLLPEPRTVAEKYARTVTFWLAFQMDRFLSVSAGRPHSISETDITSLLPAKPGTSQATIGIVDLPSNPLSLSHPNFLGNHPYDVDEFQLELKATILLGRVSDWLIRAPDPVGFNLRKYWQMPDGPIPDLRSQVDFMQLDQDINALHASLPPQFHHVFEGEGTKVSSSKVMVILIINLSIILLHECFITKDQSNLSFQRCLQASYQIKCVGDSLSGAGYDHKLLHPFSNYCWAVAVRMIMRQLVQNEIKLIELATASTSYTKALSTCWIPQSLPSTHPCDTPEVMDNEEMARLLKTEQAKVNLNLMEIESLLRFSLNHHLQSSYLDSENLNPLNFRSLLQMQHPSQNNHQYERYSPQYAGHQGLRGGYEEIRDGIPASFSTGIGGLDEAGSLDSGSGRYGLVDSCHCYYSSQLSHCPGSDQIKPHHQTPGLNESESYLDHETSTRISLQHVHSHNHHQNSTHEAKFTFASGYQQDQIKSLSQIYFDQMIKLFHTRFQALRLPKSLSRIVIS